MRRLQYRCSESSRAETQTFGSEPNVLAGFNSLRNKELGSPGRIRTYSLSVNSREDEKSKCPIWCRLREIGSHFSFCSCTHSCTHGRLAEYWSYRNALGTVGEGFQQRHGQILPRGKFSAEMGGLLTSAPNRIAIRKLKSLTPDISTQYSSERLRRVARRFAAYRKIVTVVTANTLPGCKSKARFLGTHQKQHPRLFSSSLLITTSS